jgi:hypothetical protein
LVSRNRLFDYCSKALAGCRGFLLKKSISKIELVQVMMMRRPLDSLEDSVGVEVVFIVTIGMPPMKPYNF